MTKRASVWTTASIAPICLFWILTNPAAYAQPLLEPEIVYERALESIRNEDLPLAIAHLETLRRLDPSHAGALLDLAYLYCQAGKKRRVEEFLLILESEFNPPPKILDVIDELRQRDCSIAREGTTWAVGLVLGHDSNVNQGSSVRTFSLSTGSNLTNVILTDEFLPRSSSFLGLKAYVSHAVDGKNNVYATLSAQQYASATNFDLTSLSVGHGYAFSNQNWQVSTDVHATMRTLGGSLYQESFAGSIQLLPPATYRADLPFGLDMRLAYSRYPTRTAFNSLETTFLIPSLWQLSDKVSTRLSAGWVFDKALENRPGGDRSGAVLGAEVFYRHSHEWKGYAGWQARLLDGASPYAPPLLDMVRKQRQQFISLAAERRLTENSSVRVEYQHTDNADTIPIYRFTNDTVILYWVFEGRK